MLRIYGEYIDDLRSKNVKVTKLCEIPERPAVIWVQKSSAWGLLKLNLRPYYDRDIPELLHGWVNKGYYQVDDTTFLYRHDDRYWIYRVEEV